MKIIAWTPKIRRPNETQRTISELILRIRITCMGNCTVCLLIGSVICQLIRSTTSTNKNMATISRRWRSGITWNKTELYEILNLFTDCLIIIASDKVCYNVSSRLPPVMLLAVTIQSIICGAYILTNWQSEKIKIGNFCQEEYY